MRLGLKVLGGLGARDGEVAAQQGAAARNTNQLSELSHHTTAPQPTSPPRSAWTHAEPGGMRSSRQPPSGVPNVPSPIARLLDDSGSLEPQNSILMTTKLQGYRSSMAVSGGSGAVGRPPPALPLPALLQCPDFCCHCPCLQEPYFSSKQQKSKAAGSSELVQLKKAAASMSRDFQAGGLRRLRRRVLCPDCAVPRWGVSTGRQHTREAAL